MFENLKIPFTDDLFESLKRSKGAEFTEQVKRAVSDTRCPAPKRCESRSELASWFTQFARAARAALPKREAKAAQ